MSFVHYRETLYTNSESSSGYPQLATVLLHEGRCAQQSLPGCKALNYVLGMFA